MEEEKEKVQEGQVRKSRLRNRVNHKLWKAKLAPALLLLITVIAFFIKKNNKVRETKAAGNISTDT